ncbi:MAG: hypothetical protein MUE41_15285, partial [Gemmatimonadaceae bacterium]|nr:hypothetical protein [Gemmatimonadaceae bacterium]
QAPKPATAHQHEMKKGEEHGAITWKELDSYHTLMAAAWHPAKDKSDLAPARATLPKMVPAAQALVTATRPKGCGEAAGYGEKVQALATETEKVNGMAAKASDADLKAAMKALHDTFHGVEEGCAAPKGKQEGMKHEGMKHDGMKHDGMKHDSSKAAPKKP